ncbi:protein DA1-like [Ipomoea triloba]|uniref:protein DA1-like n=1 Tax=Ipomoea triloba TaxID=35885 RepID=UPI00125E8258|nr:protein DA1-like [Ipomoea triloba]
MLGDKFNGEAPAFEEYVLHDGNTSKEISGKPRANLLNNTEQEVICDVCQEQIVKSNCLRSNLGQSYCQKHAFDGTPTCSACSRFKIRNVEFFTLNDGRMLCPDCHSTAVIDPESFKSIVSEVHNFFAALNMHIRKDIPVHLVDLFEMNILSPHQTAMPMGLTTYKIDAIPFVNWSLQQGMSIEVRHHCTVTGMTVLYGLPRLLTGRILAHEFMHTWMRLQGYNNAIGTWVEEGMCEVMAYVWLDWYALFGKEMYGDDEKASFMRNLKEHEMKRMERNPCRIYGDGFREAKSAVKIYGFEHTMKCIAYTGNFPC